MPDKIKRLLAPPVFENDEDKTRIASLLNTILLAGFTFQAVMCIGLLILTPNPLSALTSNGTLALLLLGVLFLMRRGHVRFAGMLLTSVLGGFFILTAIMSGGVFSPIFSGYIIVVMIAGMLMGGRAGVTFAVLGAMAVLGMLWADGMGYLPSSIIPIGSVVIGVGLTTDFILTAILLHLANRSLNDALERASRHERDLLAEIARRRQTEEALHKSEALFRAISEQIPDSLFLLDLEDPDVHVKIIYANEAASVMHGYPLEEIIGRSMIEADPLQMRQLFQNLIGNALKFHRQDVVPLVRVRSELLNGGEGQYRITVEDNGIGFDEKYLNRLFQVFQRLHGRSEYEGTGMGLAICRKIVERHGGHITARGVPGQGAAFIVTLPAKQPAKENP